MYIVIFEDHPGYFGPFESRDEGLRYIAESGLGEGRVVALIKPWALGTIS